MEVMDRIKGWMGKGTIRLASQGIQQKWLMRREKMSRGYTTDWDELVCVE